jgi:transposase-like protein
MPNRSGTEAAAYELLEQLRWGGPPQSCPHCGVAGRCYFLQPAAGLSRRTRTGAQSQRRVWKCGACRRQFSVLVGTIFQGSRISLRTWIGVVTDWAASPAEPTATDIADRYGLTPESARQVRRRLELACMCQPAAGGHGD